MQQDIPPYQAILSRLRNHIGERQKIQAVFDLVEMSPRLNEEEKRYLRGRLHRVHAEEDSDAVRNYMILLLLLLGDRTILSEAQAIFEQIPLPPHVRSEVAATIAAINLDRQEREWTVFLKTFLSDVQYSLAHPTIVTVSFSQDLENRKLWTMERMICGMYRGYATGPTSTVKKPGFMSFGFECQEDLDVARNALGLPEELQAGPRIFIGPQPGSGSNSAIKRQRGR